MIDPITTENVFHAVSTYYYTSMPILRTIAYSITSLYIHTNKCNVHELTHVAKAFHAVSVLCPHKLGGKMVYSFVLQGVM